MFGHSNIIPTMFLYLARVYTDYAGLTPAQGMALNCKGAPSPGQFDKGQSPPPRMPCARPIPWDGEPHNPGTKLRASRPTYVQSSQPNSPTVFPLLSMALPWVVPRESRSPMWCKILAISASRSSPSNAALSVLIVSLNMVFPFLCANVSC